MIGNDFVFSSVVERYYIFYLEQRVSLLHRKTDVLIQECAAVAEDVKEYRMLVQLFIGDHLQ